MEVSLNIKSHEDFLAQFPAGSFLQSRFWANVLALQGMKTWQINVYKHQEVVAQCLLYSHRLPMGKSYLYSAKGPLIKLHEPSEIQEAFALILTQIRDITIATERRREVFCRLEPNIAPPPLDIPSYSTSAIQPTTTLLLDLSNSVDDIFSQFKEKTRYNIRLAEKKNLEIKWGNDEEDLKKFLLLVKKTSLRHRIRHHDARHYRAIIEAGRKNNEACIASIEYQGKPIAAHLYICFGTTMTYLHGALEYNQRQLMAPYLLHWDAIQRAKAEGRSYYDFWGLAPADNSRPSWEGFSRFKKSFGGQVVVAPGAYDFVYLAGWYSIYANVRQAKSLIRRLIP